MRKRRPNLGLVLGFCLPLIYACSTDEQQISPAGYRESPVYFEMFASHYVDSMHTELLRRGEVYADAYGVTTFDGLDWNHRGHRDVSWWQVMERLVHILPLVDSPDESDRAIAWRWFDAWQESHAEGNLPNPVAWDAMSAGFRVTVFVRLLKRLEELSAQDDVIARVKKSIRRHQTFLADETNFEANNNHGAWQAIGLFESTRVFPDTALTRLALDRFLRLTEKSVSVRGFHKEHSPAYHFFYLEWLSDFVHYLESIGGLRWSGVSLLSNIEIRMTDAAYFLFDHGFKVPQIGDTDARDIGAEWSSALPADKETSRFDGEAGYAIYKDAPLSDMRRYVVFNIQSAPIEMPFHYHNDALAVYYSLDGEIVLGDQGRFDYSRTRERTFFTSPLAHNTVRSIYMGGLMAAMELADQARQRETSAGLVFEATLRGMKRSVTIARHTSSVTVTDTIADRSEHVMLWNIGVDVEEIRRDPPVEAGGATTHRFWLTTRRQRTLLLEVELASDTETARDRVEIIEGRHSPPLGWYSPGYRQMYPSKVIRILFGRARGTRVTTVVQIAGSDR